eukprot:Amastigsp_a841303_17.p3 type:complete len:192 gc:universal Amastigsp_a841303_17:1002-427(-)
MRRATLLVTSMALMALTAHSRFSQGISLRGARLSSRTTSRAESPGLLSWSSGTATKKTTTPVTRTHCSVCFQGSVAQVLSALRLSAPAALPTSVSPLCFLGTRALSVCRFSTARCGARPTTSGTTVPLLWRPSSTCCRMLSRFGRFFLSASMTSSTRASLPPRSRRGSLSSRWSTGKYATWACSPGSRSET